MIVIDAGHGGADYGARGQNDGHEKRITLEVSRKLARELERVGFQVVLTRERDEFVSLARRTAIANRAQGDLFLSIHTNSVRQTSVRGVETYFLSLEASDAEALQVAEVENQVFDLDQTAPGSDSVVGHILADLIRTDHLRASSEIAAGIQRALARVSGAGRGVKQAPFVVLMGVNMPAALVEIGFVSNAAEGSRLARSDYQRKIAREIAKAVGQYRTARAPVDAAGTGPGPEAGR